MRERTTASDRHPGPRAAEARPSAPREDGVLPRGIEILSGDLFDVSLAALVHLAQHEVVTGWLIVGRRGLVTLQRGHVSAARAGSLRGLDGLKELLFHRGGRFSLLRGEPEHTEAAAVPNTTYAIMEAYRLRDEWQRLAPQVLRVAGGRPWQATGGPLDLTVAQLDGVRTVAEAVRTLDGALTPLIDPLQQALAQGRLERAARVAPAPAAEVAAPDFFDLVERARRSIRAGELAAAEALLRQAEALRPDDGVVQQNLRALARRQREA